MTIKTPVKQNFGYPTAILDDDGKWILDCLNADIAAAIVEAVNEGEADKKCLAESLPKIKQLGAALKQATEILRWYLTPDQPIGSLPEKDRKLREKIEAFLESMKVVAVLNRGSQ